MVDPNHPYQADQARHFIETSQESLRALHTSARSDQLDTFDNGLAALQAFYAGTLIAGSTEERLYDREAEPTSREQVLDLYRYLLRNKYDLLWSDVVRGGGIMAHTATGNVAIGSDRRFTRDGTLASSIAIPAGYSFIDTWPQLAPLARVAFIKGASHALSEPIELPGLTVARRDDYQVELSGRHLPASGVSLPERFATMVREIRDPQLFMNTWRSFASTFRSHAAEFLQALNGEQPADRDALALAQHRLNATFVAAQAFPLNRRLQNSWEWSITFSNVARFNNLMTAVMAMDAFGARAEGRIFGRRLESLFDPMLHIEKVYQAEGHIHRLVRVKTPGHEVGDPTSLVSRTFIDMIDEIVYHAGLAAMGNPVDLEAYAWSDGTVSLQDRTLNRKALSLFEPGEAGRKRLEAIEAHPQSEASVLFNPGRYGEGSTAVGEIVIKPRERIHASARGGDLRPAEIGGFAVASGRASFFGNAPLQRCEAFLNGAQALLNVRPMAFALIPGTAVRLR